jgi:hypothetical protein
MLDLFMHPALLPSLPRGIVIGGLVLLSFARFTLSISSLLLMESLRTRTLACLVGIQLKRVCS